MFKKWKIMLYFFLLVFNKREVSTTYQDPSATVIKSAFAVPVSDVVIHNSVVPAEFVIMIPNITLPTAPRNCKASPFLCKLVNLTREVQNVLADEIYSANPYLRDPPHNTSEFERTERGLFNFVGQIQNFLWGTATEGEIDRLHMDTGILAAKFNKFSNESYNYMHSLASNITAYSRNLSNVVETGFTRIEVELNKTVREINVAEIVLADITNNLVLNQHIESVVEVMNNVASDCRNQLIPRSVLTDRMLDEKINVLSDIIFKHNYVVATTLDKLFNLKITKCIFTRDSIEIIVSIPIKRRNTRMKMFKLIHVPFSFGREECSLLEATTYVAQVNQSMIPITSDLSRLCPMQKNTLCLLPEGIYEPSRFAQCAKALSDSKPSDISTYCVMKCQDSTRVRVQAFSSRQFIVSNAKNFTLKCGSNKETKYRLTYSVGAVLLSLNCTCSVSVFDHFTSDTHSIHPSWPCTVNHGLQAVQISQIIPVQMSSLRSAIFDDSSDFFANASEVININWKNTVPTLSVEPPKLVQFSSQVIADQMAHQVNYSTTILYIWVSILSVGLFGLGIVTIINSQSTATRGGFNMVPFMVLMHPGFVFSLTETNVNVTFKDYMWSILSALEIFNVITNAIIVVFVVFVLIFLWKSLKNIRIVGRMIRAMDGGEDIVLSKGF